MNTEDEISSMTQAARELWAYQNGFKDDSPLPARLKLAQDWCETALSHLERHKDKLIEESTNAQQAEIFANEAIECIKFMLKITIAAGVKLNG